LDPKAANTNHSSLDNCEIRDFSKYWDFLVLEVLWFVYKINRYSPAVLIFTFAIVLLGNIWELKNIWAGLVYLLQNTAEPKPLIREYDQIACRWWWSTSSAMSTPARPMKLKYRQKVYRQGSVQTSGTCFRSDRGIICKHPDTDRCQHIDSSRSNESVCFSRSKTFQSLESVWRRVVLPHCREPKSATQGKKPRYSLSKLSYCLFLHCNSKHNLWYCKVKSASKQDKIGKFVSLNDDERLKEVAPFSSNAFSGHNRNFWLPL